MTSGRVLIENVHKNTKLKKICSVVTSEIGTGTQNIHYVFEVK